MEQDKKQSKIISLHKNVIDSVVEYILIIQSDTKGAQKIFQGGERQWKNQDL